jgi:cytochrome c-type biogenesis protein CcsB
MEDLLFKLAIGGYALAALLYAGSALLSKEGLVRAARIVLYAVVLFLVGSVVVRWSAAGRPPFSNLYESLIIFAGAIPIIYLVLDSKYDLRSAGVFVSFLALLLMIYASRLDREIHPLMPALKSNWLVTHVLTCFIAYASFAISCICSILYLVFQKKGNASRCEQMDLVTYKTVAFGFLFLSIGIMTGSVWAEKAWGRYWGWDPKETWALVTWLIYAFYLHMRVVKGWKGSAGSWISIVGFAAVIFTYLGVSYLLYGLHSYAG